MPYSRRTFLATAGALLTYWPHSDQKKDAEFVYQNPVNATFGPDLQTPRFTSCFIEHVDEIGYVHCPSLCEVSPGFVVCAWYAGSREGGKDVAVWLSELGRPQIDDSSRQPANDPNIEWSDPRIIMDPGIATAELERFVKKVGNALVFADAEGRLWLVYTSIAMGGWSGSSLNVRCSLDHGRTWQPSQRLSLSPCFNLSELVRAAPVRLTSGEIGVPIYHEFIGQFPEMLWLSPNGTRLSATKTRMTGGHSFIQPAIVPMGPRHGIAYLRNLTSDRCISYQETHDAGQSWSEPMSTNLPNPNSSMAAARLSNGSVLMAFNDSKENRENMTLAVSPDGISPWRRICVLDQVASEYFAYPFLNQSSDGVIHLVYSWKMKKVRHVAFNEAWVANQLSNTPLARNGGML